jgi:hypothetical protein
VVGIGSPFADYQSQRPQIIQRLERPFKVRFGKYSSKPGKEVDFTIKMVAPFPQTAGAFLDQSTGPIGKAHPEWARQNVVVIDLGLGQTGMAYMAAGEPFHRGCFSIDEPAFIRVAKTVQKFISSEYRRDLIIPECLEIIEAGEYRIKGEKIDLKNVIELEAANLARGVRKRYEENVPVRQRDMADAILLVGGGSLAQGT